MENKQIQKGAVLIVSLIMLIVMSLLGVSAMQTTILEEKMAGNLRDKSAAFEAAESGARDGESLLVGLADITSFNGTGGRLAKTDPEPDYRNPTTWNSNYIAYTGTLPGVASQPKYIIQHVGVTSIEILSLEEENHNEPNHQHEVNACNVSGSEPVPEPDNSGGVENIFKVTAKGIGRTGNSSAIVQTYYRSNTGRVSWNELK